MSELREVGRKEGVSLADVDMELEPVPRRRDWSRAEAMLLQPRVDGRDTVGAGSNELRYLE